MIKTTQIKKERESQREGIRHLPSARIGFSLLDFCLPPHAQKA